MRVHVCACVHQAVLEPLNLPNQRLGYTYVICTAGGDLAHDRFSGADLITRQFVTPDMRQLSRVFTYTTTATSTFDAAVLQQCGSSIAMNVGDRFSLSLFCYAALLLRCSLPRLLLQRLDCHAVSDDTHGA